MTQYQIPILLTTFNRLDTVKQVFNTIRTVKPKKLYLASDGPRSEKPNEGLQVNAVRDYLLTNIDWDCEVHTLFRESNLGCGLAMSSAITWFFEHEEMGIILEDDVVPNLSFFGFCKELLERYAGDRRIGSISGSNHLNYTPKYPYDYFFSLYNHIWGWATWASRWKNYDFYLQQITNTSFLDKISDDAFIRRYWKEIFAKVKDRRIDTWNYQWTFTLWYNNQLSITPKYNLVKNIGFSAQATHTVERPKSAKQYTQKISIRSHPDIVAVNPKIERDIFYSHYHPPEALLKKYPYLAKMMAKQILEYTSIFSVDKFKSLSTRLLKRAIR